MMRRTTINNRRAFTVRHILMLGAAVIVPLAMAGHAVAQDNTVNDSPPTVLSTPPADTVPLNAPPADTGSPPTTLSTPQATITPQNTGSAPTVLSAPQTSMAPLNVTPAVTGSGPTALSMPPTSMTPLMPGQSSAGSPSTIASSGASAPPSVVHANNGLNIPAGSTKPAGGLPVVPGAPPAMSSDVPGASATGQIANQANDQQWEANAFSKLEEALSQHAAVAPPTVRPEDLKTLFFTAWQYALLNEAKQLFKTRPPSAGESSGNPAAPKPTGPREISLGGISFTSGKSWTVWLNRQRIKPDAIPKEVLDIKVSSDHVDLKWFDASTNLIYPIRLHPHERFNLDDRIFLPGAGT